MLDTPAGSRKDPSQETQEEEPVVATSERAGMKITSTNRWRCGFKRRK